MALWKILINIIILESQFSVNIREFLDQRLRQTFLKEKYALLLCRT